MKDKRILKKLLAGVLSFSMALSILPMGSLGEIKVGAEADPYVELSQTLTASDSFAWKEYDHLNYSDRYATSIPKHIIYDGNNIKMIGYGDKAYKDFLLVEDTENKNSKKIFTFDIKRDGTDWHSMEGGGFLFNASITNNTLKGFCLLITSGGLKLIQLSGVNADTFRNSSSSTVQSMGKVLATYSLSNLYAEHKFKIEVDNTTVSAWDNDKQIINNYSLPTNSYGYGYGPITSHDSHSCSQQSYFTFANIEMQEIIVHYIPKAPTNLSYKLNEDSSIALSWTAPNGKAIVKGYNVYRDDVLIDITTKTTFTDESSITLGDFKYYVCAFDEDEYLSAASDSIIADNLPPTTPKLIVDSVFDTSATLSWECSDNIDIAVYDIYRNNKLIDTVSSKSYNDKTLEEGALYSYYIIAKDKAGNISDTSNIVNISTTIDETQPIITSISPANGTYYKSLPLKVTVTDNRSVSSVTLQYSYDKKNWIDISIVNTDGKTNTTIDYAFDISNFDNGIIYVQAIATNSRNIISNPAESPIMQYNIDNSIPSAPKDLSVNLLNSQIEIRWAAPQEDNIAFFKVYRKTEVTDNYILLKDNYKYLNYYDTDIELGMKYSYQVSAVDTMGREGIFSNEVNGCIENDKIKPEIISIYPTTGTVLNTNQLIGISAKDNFKLNKIVVECRSENGEWETIHTEKNINLYSKAIQFTLNTTEFKTGNYEIRACAYDTSGNISDYSIAQYSFKECKLSSPTLSTTGEGWRNELKWTMENNEDLMGYHVYRKTTASGTYSLLASIKSNTYTDKDVTPGKTYYYLVEAVDSRNNFVKSNETTSIPTDIDSVQPLADAGFDIIGIAGDKINFNGSNSWDNHYIASYEWDFGDGNAATGAKITHTYETDGTYNVTLTVTDSAGNSDSHTIQAYIYSDDNGSIQFKVTDEVGRALSNVKIYCEIPGIDNTDYITDSSGNFKLIAPKGTYDVYFYKNEYLPVNKQVKIADTNASQKISLEKKELLDGKLTVKPLDINEMISLGIDVNAPENQFVYQYNIDYGKDGKLTFTLNAMGDIIGEVEGKIQKERDGVFTTVATIKGEKDRPVSTSYGGYSEGSGIPVSVAVFNVTTQVSWLKEFFDVELTIINNADDEFYIQNSQAVLSLPDGLSLANTARQESLTQVMGKNGVIGGNETKSVSWIVRGDKAGSYDLSATFTGTLMPFCDDVKVIFKTENPLIVHDGTGLKLDITVTEGLDYWSSYFEFTNNSERPIYNFAASFSGYAELAEVTDMMVLYPDGTIEIIEWNNGKPNLENIEVFLPALTDSEYNQYTHRTINPGEKVTGWFKIYRKDGYTNDSSHP